jgi:hypothetical protein
MVSENTVYSLVPNLSGTTTAVSDPAGYYLERMFEFYINHPFEIKLPHGTLHHQTK